MTDSKSTKYLSEDKLAGLYSKIEDSEDNLVEFYVNLLQNYQAPMLEVNCGTGLILSKLQELGIACDGVEASAEQLRVCSERLNSIGKNAHLYNTDFADFEFPNKYRAIFVPNGTFCMIADYDKAFHCLEMLESSLENGGTLIMDIFVPWKSLTNRNNNSWKIGKSLFDPKTGEDFVFSYYDSFDLSKQIRTTHSKYELFVNGELNSVRLDVVRNHWYGDNEFALMLEKAGFDNVSYQRIFEKSEDEYSTLFIASKLK